MFFNEYDHKTLDEINKEIGDLERVPMGQRTPNMADRLRALRVAKSRVTGHVPVSSRTVRW